MCERLAVVVLDEKQAPLSSMVHGGGKRRGAMLIGVGSAESQGLPKVPFRETWAR
jgi:hypothetical protein